MAADEIHVGDVGTVLEVTVKEGGVAVNMTALTPRELLLRKPSGTVLTKAGVAVTDFSDGKMKYTTVAGDLAEAGEWRLQAVVATWKSDVQRFIVHANIS